MVLASPETGILARKRAVHGRLSPIQDGLPVGSKENAVGLGSTDSGPRVGLTGFLHCAALLSSVTDGMSASSPADMTTSTAIRN